jgi:hypothetical protein
MESKFVPRRIVAIGDGNLLLGTLLGDASFNQLAKRAKSRGIRWEHADKQRDYALWKAREIGFPYTTFYRERLDNRTNKIYKSFSVLLKATPIFNIAYLRMCPDGKKTVTQELLDCLTPKAVAVWYCDDGNLYCSKDCHQLTLSTDSFTRTENQLIVTWFKKKYDINFTLNIRNIRLNSLREIIKFMDIFEKYVPECMNYKKLSVYKNTYQKDKNFQCTTCLSFFKRDLGLKQHMNIFHKQLNYEQSI